uniref:WAT1-related protein n=2 Tax=Aegilops tauschii subsp. strangulata TaxID=200361 RepID=A0A453D6K6_AEGTS
MEVDGKKPYVIAVIIQVIATGMLVTSKAAYNQGFNTYVFVFYRQAAASLLLLPLAIVLERKNIRLMSFRLLMKLFLYALFGTTFSLNLYNVSLKLTSATVGSATSNSMPVVTFIIALLLRMEVVKLRSPSGIAKVAGVGLCLAGVLAIAFYVGPSLDPVNHHRAFAVANGEADAKRGTWIMGTLLMVLVNVTWSLWIVLQAALLKEFPHKLLVTATQCAFSAGQCFVVAAVAERDFSRWQLGFDVTLVAVLYTGFVVTGVSYYLQAWCADMRGPVFLAVWNPLCFVFTIFCSSFFLGEIVHLGSILGGILLVGGLYSVLWGKSKENRTGPCGEPIMMIHGVGDGKSADEEEKNARSKQVNGEMEHDKEATDERTCGYDKWIDKPWQGRERSVIANLASKK